MGKKVLVFGATGEIGGRIAHLAVKAGHDVTGVTRGGNTKKTVCLDGVKMIHGDKDDESFIRDTVAKLPVDVVVDSVPKINNVSLYQKYLKQAENVFFCGSTGTFTPLQYLPADENHPWREKTAVNFFHQSQRDALALDLWESDQFPITIFRPTCIVGEHRVPLELWGARDINFYRKLKAGEPITIAPCEHILIQCGYNWDLAGAFVQAIDYPDKVRGEIFIISCKKAITLGKYLQTAMEFLNSKSEISHVPAEKLQDIYPEVTMKFRMDFLLEHMCLDISKAENTLGYRPTLTSGQGLVKALEWCESSGLL